MLTLKKHLFKEIYKYIIKILNLWYNVLKNIVTLKIRATDLQEMKGFN